MHVELQEPKKKIFFCFVFEHTQNAEKETIVVVEDLNDPIIKYFEPPIVGLYDLCLGLL